MVARSRTMTRIMMKKMMKTTKANKGEVVVTETQDRVGI
jgi:hypothetical protein